MKVRKRNRHLAKLSFEKQWGYWRPDEVLIMWNMNSKKFKEGRKINRRKLKERNKYYELRKQWR